MLDKTKNYKIDVSQLSTVERTALQKQLFLLGYAWYADGQNVIDLDSATLFLEKDMEITCGNKYDFNHCNYPILTVSDIMPQPEERTLRDWFAGMVMQGLFSNSEVKRDFNLIVESSFVIADAMLKERNK